MTALPPAAPVFGDRVDPCRPSSEALALLATRRSTTAKTLGAPGPDPDQLKSLLRVAARVPDHGKRAPWRFIVFEGEARARFGAILADRWRAREPEADAARLALERERFLRAPVVVTVVSAITSTEKIPEWEQVLSAGAVCQPLLIAANAMGFAGQWLTEWCAYDAEILSALGLVEGERVAGYVYLGAAQEPPMERARPDVAAKTAYWG
ncbi:MAG: nitroreductase [Maricaulaceae bacterium]